MAEKRKIGLLIFIIIIMIGTSFSAIFYGFSGPAQTENYSGIKFKRASNHWLAKINERQAAFSFLPNEVKDIQIDPEITNRLKNKYEIDATYDLNSTFKESIALAHHQMGLTLAEYNLYIRKGFTTNNTFNLPIITCKDSTKNVPVIYFTAGNETKLSVKNDCIIAEASSNADVIRLKDRIVYSILGVIE